MSIQQAVEEKKSQAPAKVSQAQLIRKAIEVQGSAFEAVLPKNVDAERFGRLVLTAVKTTPELMKCFATEEGKASVLYAAMQAATVGLEPNTPTQECWLLPRKNKGVTECELQIGYRGYLKLTRASGGTLSVRAEVVREGDEFDYSFSAQEDQLRHKPIAPLTAERTHAWARVLYTNGGYKFVVLRKEDVEARRAKSASWSNEKARPYSPWTTSTDAMWRKSAILALTADLDLSPTAAAAVAADGKTIKFEDGELLPAGEDVLDLEGEEMEAAQ